MSEKLFIKTKFSHYFYKFISDSYAGHNNIQYIYKSFLYFVFNLIVMFNALFRNFLLKILQG